jgi:hypothetical protein
MLALLILRASLARYAGQGERAEGHYRRGLKSQFH